MMELCKKYGRALMPDIGMETIGRCRNKRCAKFNIPVSMDDDYDDATD